MESHRVIVLLSGVYVGSCGVHGALWDCVEHRAACGLVWGHVRLYRVVVG